MTTQAKPTGTRLQKLLADAGICSRRAAETLIRQGRVKVNGRTVTELGSRATADDAVAVDGKPLARKRESLYIMLHKPAGIVTTLRDPEGRPTVRTLLARDLPRLFPVGRLDVQSTGLLLLTNDGELAARLTHPRYHVRRVYRVKVRGKLDDRTLGRLRRGVHLEDGATSPAEVTVERELPTKSWLRIVVHEGRTHLVRRMCHAVGHGADKLQRVAFGPLDLGRLPLGGARVLTPAEVRSLRRAVELEREAPPRTARAHDVPLPRRAPRERPAPPPRRAARPRQAPPPQGGPRPRAAPPPRARETAGGRRGRSTPRRTTRPAR